MNFILYIIVVVTSVFRLSVLAVLKLIVHDASHKCGGLSLYMLSIGFPFPALPAVFKEELKNEEVTEGVSVCLHCELSKAAPVQWKIGSKVLEASDKYQMSQPGTTAELVIRDLDITDAGDYTCVCGDQKTTATLTVHGKKSLLKLRDL